MIDTLQDILCFSLRRFNFKRIIDMSVAERFSGSKGFVDFEICQNLQIVFACCHDMG